MNTGELGDPRSRGRVFAAGGAIAAAALAVYSNSFGAPFFFDDLKSIPQNPTIRHLLPLGPVLSPPAGGLTVEGRPILNLSLAVNYAISGTDVWSYHAVNLLIHALAGLALFGIARRTLERLGPRAGAFNGPGEGRSFLAALAIALLWTVHPLQTEAVTYVIQRAESLMGLFYLFTLYCFIRYAEGGGPSWAWLSAASCFLGMGTKEVAVTLPVIVFLYDRTFVAGSFREAWNRRWRVHAGLAAGWLLLAGLLASGGGNRSGSKGFGTGVSWPAWELTQFEAVVHYLRLVVWPHPLIFSYDAVWIGLAQAVPYAMAFAALAAATIWALVRAPALGFLGFWFFGILSVTSLVPGNGEMIVEHRMYLPLAAVVALAVWAVFSWMGRWSGGVCLALAVGFGGFAWSRNADYGSVLSIWSDTVAKQPGYAKAHDCLAVELARIPGRLPEALEQYKMALEIDPHLAEAHNNLAIALVQIPGRTPEALAHLEDALRIRPDYAEAHTSLANILIEMPGRQSEALDHYEQALRIDPGQAQAHCALAGVLERMPGRLPDALNHYARALDIDPNYAEAHCNLGSLLVAIPGRLPEALKHYEQALRINPEFAEAHYNLANALAGIPGRLPEALDHYAQALRIRPDFVEAHYNIAAALIRSGRSDEAMGHLEAVLRLDPGNGSARSTLERLKSRRVRIRPD